MAKLSLGSSSGKKSQKTRTTRGGSKVFLAAAIAFAVVAAAMVFIVLGQVTSTVTYYVLNQDVPARTQVTEDMLTPVTTSQGGQPRNALDISHLSPDPVFARYHLSAGDILTPSNVGLYSPIQEGIPADYTVASFSVPAENAVAGKVSRGDYIDIIATNNLSETGEAQYVLRHVLVVDTAADLAAEAQSANTVDGSEDGAVRSGVPTLYTVALPEADAAKLALLQGLPLLVTLTPIDYDGSDTSPIIANPADVFGPDVVIGDSGARTSPTFDIKAPVPAGEDNGESEAPADDAEVEDEPTAPEGEETSTEEG